MNKLTLVLLSIIAGMDVLVRVLTPILLVWLWLSIFGIPNHWTNYVFIFLGISSSLFRSIKIGFLNK